MRIRGVLSAAIVVAATMSFAGTASALQGMFFVCNSDGYEHCLTYYENPTGYCDVTTNKKCGLGVNFPMGDGFEIIFSEKTQVSPKGQEFLKRLEEGGMTPAERVPVRVKGAPPKLPGQPHKIYLKRADVSPVLAGYLTSIAPDWRGETAPKAASSATAGTIVRIVSAKHLGAYLMHKETCLVRVELQLRGKAFECVEVRRQS